MFENTYFIIDKYRHKTQILTNRKKMEAFLGGKEIATRSTGEFEIVKVYLLQNGNLKLRCNVDSFQNDPSYYIAYKDGKISKLNPSCEGNKLYCEESDCFLPKSLKIIAFNLFMDIK